MAFGYPYQEDPKPTIDSNKHQPVTVIANFNPEGKIIPVYVSLEDLYGNVCKCKIDGVKYTKDGKGHTTYCCTYNNGRRQCQINLIFFHDEHVWVMDR